MSSSNTPPCAACKCMRRRCTEDCVFAPYFPSENLEKFMNVHRSYGASNFARILRSLDPSEREEAANTLCFEASQRRKDPIYGCVGWIAILQERIEEVQCGIEAAMRELSTYFIDPSDMSQALNALGRQRYGSSFQMKTQMTCNDAANHHQQEIMEQAAALREQEMLRHDFGQQSFFGNGGLCDDGGCGVTMAMQSPCYDHMMLSRQHHPTANNNNNH